MDNDVVDGEKYQQLDDSGWRTNENPFYYSYNFSASLKLKKKKNLKILYIVKCGFYVLSF